MYASLRWRLQIPNYFPHTPIPADDELSTFSRGVKCAYRDLLKEIEEIEKAEEQFRIWPFRKEKKNVMFGTWNDEEYDFIEEIRKY